MGGNVGACLEGLFYNNQQVKQEWRECWSLLGGIILQQSTGKTRMTTFIKAKLKKSDHQMNIDTAANITKYHIKHNSKDGHIYVFMKRWKVSCVTS